MPARKREVWVGPQFSAIHKDWEMPFLALREIPLIIGLVGPSRVGKTMVARRLVTEMGFHYEKTSTVLEEYGLLLGRNLKKELGWEEKNALSILLRRQRGAAEVVKLILQKIERLYKDQSRFVIDGVIHPDDADLLLSTGHAHLIALVASREIRAKEASHWFSRDEEELRNELNSRDIFENYDHPPVERYLNNEVNSIEIDSIDDDRTDFTPDIMACLGMVPRDNFIHIRPRSDDAHDAKSGIEEESPRNAFIKKNIFDPLDEIMERLVDGQNRTNSNFVITNTTF